MRKAIILTVFIAAGLAYGASDTWKTKPYQQWDQNDIKEVLTNSPWVKRTTVVASWRKGSLNAPEPSGQNPPSQGNPPAAQPRPGTTGGSAGATQPNNNQQSTDMPDVTNAMYAIRWSSALTVREAVARDAVLNGHSTEAQATQYVQQEPNAYEVLVFGPDMTPFTNETDDTLKSKAYIVAKPSKERVSPSNVEIVKDTDGKKIKSILFSFPKQGPNGQPLFGPDAKQAQFDCKLKEIHLDASFDLRKMMGANGRDL